MAFNETFEEALRRLVRNRTTYGGDSFLSPTDKWRTESPTPNLIGDTYRIAETGEIFRESYESAEPHGGSAQHGYNGYYVRLTSELDPDLTALCESARGEKMDDPPMPGRPFNPVEDRSGDAPGMVLIYHIFKDNIDNHTHDPREAYKTYFQWVAEGAPNVRLYRERYPSQTDYEDCRNCEEDSILGAGNFPA